MNEFCRWVRACDVADESASEAADNGGGSSASSIFEKTSLSAQGLSYTAARGPTSTINVPEAALKLCAQTIDVVTVGGDACSGNACSVEQSFTQSSGARFWSLACVIIMMPVTYDLLDVV